MFDSVAEKAGLNHTWFHISEDRFSHEAFFVSGLLYPWQDEKETECHKQVQTRSGWGIAVY